MKIVHVPFCFYPDPVGGTEVYVSGLAAVQLRRGDHPLVAAPGPADASYEHGGLPVRRFAVPAAVADLRALYDAGDPAAAAAFGRLLDAERPDLVHLHAFTRGASLLALREARRRGIPTVFTYHTPTVSCQRGTLLRWGREPCDGRLDHRACAACTLQGRGLAEPAARLLGWLPPAVGRALGARGRSGGAWTGLRMGELLELRHRAVRALLAEADALVALCDWARALLLRNGAPPAKVRLSRHGLAGSPAHPAPPRPPGGELRLAFLGRLDRAKGADLLLAALRALPGAPLRLDIYGVAQPGDEPYAAELGRLAAADARVRLLPPVASAGVVALLAGYDLLAAPSRVLETGPLVVLEAFAAGLPVLGSRLGGIAELVRDGADGLLAPPDDPAAWATALRRLLDEPGLLARLRAGVRSPRRIEEVADEMRALYLQLAQAQ